MKRDWTTPTKCTYTRFTTRPTSSRDSTAGAALHRAVACFQRHLCASLPAPTRGQVRCGAAASRPPRRSIPSPGQWARGVRACLCDQPRLLMCPLHLSELIDGCVGPGADRFIPYRATPALRLPARHVWESSNRTPPGGENEMGRIFPSGRERTHLLTERWDHHGKCSSYRSNRVHPCITRRKKT